MSCDNLSSLPLSAGANLFPTLESSFGINLCAQRSLAERNPLGSTPNFEASRETWEVARSSRRRYLFSSFVNYCLYVFTFATALSEREFTGQQLVLLDGVTAGKLQRGVAKFKDKLWKIVNTKKLS